MMGKAGYEAFTLKQCFCSIDWVTGTQTPCSAAEVRWRASLATPPALSSEAVGEGQTVK